MKKILVIGCMGMAGHVIKRYLESTGKYAIWGLARGVLPASNLISLDVFDTARLEKHLKEKAFDVVVNCVGVSNKIAENDVKTAIWLNSYLPHLLASYGGKYNFKLVHISTDCVFSGRDGHYKEDSFRDGTDYYARSKALGEVINDRDLTFRTSIIGPELKQDGIGLFHWFMNQNNKVAGFSRVYWSGVTTPHLAKAIEDAIDQELAGLYHLTNNSKISKYQLLEEINDIFREKQVTITPNSDYQSDKSLINSRTDFDYKVPDYALMVKDMKSWMMTYNEFYTHYNKVMT